MLDEEDVLLIQRNKDHAAFERLYKRWYDKIKYTTTRYYVRNESDVDDFLQEFWIRVWEKIDLFEHKSAFGTWLYRLLTNFSYNYHKKKSLRLDNETTFDEMDEELLYEADSIIDNFDLELIKEAFERAAERLPPPILEVWKLHHNGMSYREIEEKYHWAYKTLREYVYLANLILREEILYVTKRENDLNT